jgi:hypothetical protein
MAREVMTIRVDRVFRTRLRAVARRRRASPSAVARQALEGWLESEEGSAGARPYDAIADLIGSLRGGDPGRSARGRAWIVEELKRRAARRDR